jgi:hypothetical protein
MNNDKHLIIHFNNGEKMELAFPQQIKNSLGALVEAAQRLLDADKLVVHTEERVLIVPWASVQYVEASAVPPAALPLGVIKGARIVESHEQPVS